MKELSFDSGLVSYSLNGKCEVSFNPADRSFAERFYNTFDEMGKLMESYAKKAEDLEDASGAFALARQRDEEMGKVLDGLFNAPVCAEVFGEMSLCAFAGGFPAWLNLMLAILDEIEVNISDIQKQADPRIAKYKAKYQKYANRFHK